MEDKPDWSCWGSAKWTFLCFLGVVAVVWLFGGFEPSAIAAAR